MGGERAGAARSGSMRGVFMVAPTKVEVRASPLPGLGDGDILVRTSFVGICGTDIHLYGGHSFYLEHGFLSYPFIFGHEYSGVIERVGAGVTGLSVGDRVVGHCMVPCQQCDNCQAGRRHLCRNLREVGLRSIQGAAADFVCVPAYAVTRLPEGLSMKAAALVEPAVTAYHACERARITPSDRVAVVGSGTLGLLSLMVAKLSARSVDVIGVAPSELELAGELGATRLLHPSEVPENAYDVVVETSGVASALSQAIRIADLGARVALVGLPGRHSLEVDQTSIALKDLSIHGILHGLNYYGHVVDLFASGRVDPTRLIAEVGRPEAVPSMYERLGRPARKQPKYLIEFAGE